MRWGGISRLFLVLGGVRPRPGHACEFSDKRCASCAPEPPFHQRVAGACEDIRASEGRKPIRRAAVSSAGGLEAPNRGRAASVTAHDGDCWR